MNERDRQLYELALKEGERRFGSECPHTHVRNGRCTQCLRRVITKGITPRKERG